MCGSQFRRNKVESKMNPSNAFLAALLTISMMSVIMADPIPFKDCGTKGASNTKLDISGCSKLPCIFAKNTNASMVLSFTPTQSYKKLTNVVYGVIAGVKVPFPLPQGDACSNGIQCPVNANQLYSETIQIPVESLYPSISLYVQYQVNDENNNVVLCTLFPVKIQ